MITITLVGDDGLGGHVIISKVDPSTSVDAKNASSSKLHDVDDQIPVVVEVDIECKVEDEASVCSSDEDFLGFLDEEVKDAQAYIKRVSSSRQKSLIKNDTNPKQGFLGFLDEEVEDAQAYMERVSSSRGKSFIKNDTNPKQGTRDSSARNPKLVSQDAEVLGHGPANAASSTLSVASKNKRKSLHVRKHPLYENPDAHTVATDSLKTVDQSAHDKNAATDMKRSSRTRKIPGRFLDDILDFGWLKTQLRGDTASCVDYLQPDVNITKGSAMANLRVTDDSKDSDESSPGMTVKRARKVSSDTDDPEAPVDNTKEGFSYKSTKTLTYLSSKTSMEVDAEYRAPTDVNISLATSGVLLGDGPMRFKAWSCNLCSYKTNSEQCIKIHLRAHTKKSLKCVKCKYLAVGATQLKIHMRKHTGEKPFKCNICEYSCTTNSALKVHVKNHIGDKPHACPHCDHRALTKSHLDTHVTTHTGVRPFACPSCSYKTAFPGHLRRHQLSHTGEKPFKCLVCTFATSRKHKLKTHMNKHVPGKEQHPCPECDFIADFPFTLKRHMFEHAIDEHCYKCPYCDLITAVPALLRDHVKTHAGEPHQPFRCLSCSYSHELLHHMRGHMKSHVKTGETFKCDDCSYTTTFKHKHERHKVVHKDKWLICDVCSKKYRTESELEDHVKICKDTDKLPDWKLNKELVEDKTKRFKCSKCDFASMYYTQLKAHTKTHSKYQCHKCDYGSNSKSHIIMHTRTHSENKPFKCTECDFTTANTITLRQHRIGHSDLWSFTCDECDRKFRLKVHLEHHKEKGCDWEEDLPAKHVDLKGLKTDETRKTSHSRTTRSSTLSLPIKKENGDEFHY